MFNSQSEAKRFVVEQVLAQARAENVQLSDAERRMLSWSESDPDFIVDHQLPAQLASEMSAEEYERKVAGLLSRRFGVGVGADPAAEAQWRQAAEVLHQGDHYILVMLDEALGSRVKRWWQFWR
jgi:hypothetical protein